MNIEAVRHRYPLPQGSFEAYLRPRISPPLDITRLEVGFMAGSERSELVTPTIGNISHILQYKGKEGAVSSFEIRHDVDLVLVQLQGARSRVSWRVATAVRWDTLLLDEAVQIATIEESGIQRIGMPNPLLIRGIEDAESEDAFNRYEAFIIIAALQWSAEDQLYIRDIKPGV